MRATKTAVVLALALFFVGSASWAAAKFTCSGAGKVWTITPGSYPIDMTMMVAKASTDCDLLVTDGFGNVVALGVGLESRFEKVAFGPLPGVRLRVTAIKASGSNSKAYLRCSDSRRFVRGGGDDGLRPLGTAEELAAKDSRYARALERFKRLQNLKVPSAGAE